MEFEEYMYDADYLSAPTPLPSFHHCDYTDWTPSLSIIPAVYLLAFCIGCLGNGLVLWAYLDRPDGRKKITIRDRSGASNLCCFSICKQDMSSEVPQNGGQSSSCRPMSQVSAISYPPSIPRSTRSLTESLIASLALADLCFLVTLPLWAVYTALGYHWPFGQPLCQISSFLTALNMYASVFSLSMLSVERYWVLTGRRHSGHLPHQRFPTRAVLIIAGVWLLSCILALPGLLLRSVKETETAGDDWQEEPAHPTQPGLLFLSCQMDYSILIGENLTETEREHAEMWWAAILSLKSTLIGFLFPLIILLICYCSLAKLLSKHFGKGPHPDRKRQRRLLRVIVTLVLAFFLCWLPLHVNKTVAVLLGFGFVPYSCTLDTILLSAQPYVTCIAYLNSCLNPLLYAACDPAFRKRCRGALFFLCSVKRRREEKSGMEKEEGEGGKEEKTQETADRTEEDRLG